MWVIFLRKTDTSAHGKMADFFFFLFFLPNVVSRKCPEFRRGCWLKGTQSDVTATSLHSHPARIIIYNLATFFNIGRPATCPPPPPAGPTGSPVTCRATRSLDRSTRDPPTLSLPLIRMTLQGHRTAGNKAQLILWTRKISNFQSCLIFKKVAPEKKGTVAWGGRNPGKAGPLRQVGPHPSGGCIVLVAVAKGFWGMFKCENVCTWDCVVYKRTKQGCKSLTVDFSPYFINKKIERKSVLTSSRRYWYCIWKPKTK